LWYSIFVGYHDRWILTITNMIQVMDYEEKTQARKVAPYNPNLRWPKGYYEVLHELGIEHQHDSFYSHWVSQFFSRHRGERRGEISD